jgi:uncharacterized membrane protein
MMIHPATVHFAMVLPVVAAVFGVAYIISRNELMSKIAARTTLVAALAMIGVWYTGSQAGPQIFEYLSKAGQHELLEHKQLGLYLAIAMALIALLQIVACRLKKFTLELLAIILLIGAMFTTFLQGKDGGEIVYNYGMPFKAYMIEDSLQEAVTTAQESEDCDLQLEAYEDAIDDIVSLSEDIDTIYGNKPKNQENSSDE